MRGYLRSICTILQPRNKFPNWEFITQASTIEHIIIMLRIKTFENASGFYLPQVDFQHGAISVPRFVKTQRLNIAQNVKHQTKKLCKFSAFISFS